MMSRIFVPTTGAESWRALLASPERHWRISFSARALAYCWEEADGFPSEIQRLFSTCAVPALQQPTVLFAFPEYKVALPGRGAASQSDVFVIAKANDGTLATITVEGKVNESFDETVAEWLVGSSTGKQQRLAFLQQQLGLADQDIGHIRYQLLHRTVAAVLEAQRLNARYAISIVHSFSQTDQWFGDYEQFTALFGHSAAPNHLVQLFEAAETKVYSAWVRGDPAYLTR